MRRHALWKLNDQLIYISINKVIVYIIIKCKYIYDNWTQETFTWCLMICFVLCFVPYFMHEISSLKFFMQNKQQIWNYFSNCISNTWKVENLYLYLWNLHSGINFNEQRNLSYVELLYVVRKHWKILNWNIYYKFTFRKKTEKLERKFNYIFMLLLFWWR